MCVYSEWLDFLEQERCILHCMLLLLLHHRRLRPRLRLHRPFIPLLVGAVYVRRN